MYLPVLHLHFCALHTTQPFVLQLLGWAESADAVAEGKVRMDSPEYGIRGVEEGQWAAGLYVQYVH